MIKYKLTDYKRRKSWIIGITSMVLIFSIAGLTYVAMRNYVNEQVEMRVRDVMQEAKALHEYIQLGMHPAMYRLKQEGRMPEDFYAPEILSSSYITRQVFHLLNKERKQLNLPEIEYKMASKNPRNKANLADSLEAALIDMFNADTSVTEYTRYITNNGVKYLYYARPFLKINKKCLVCHGSREESPHELRDYYAWEGGFNLTEGLIPAIEIVNTPVVGEHRKANIIFLIIVFVIVVASVLVFGNARLRTLNREYAEDNTKLEDKYQKLFNTTNDAIYIHDLQGNMLEVNEVACKSLGYNKKQLLLLKPNDIDDTENAEKTPERIARVIEDGIYLFETVHVKRNGNKFPCEVKSTVINYNNKKAILSSVRDISERKTFEAELVKAKEKAEESDKLKTTFLANMSHEIRTPMNGIVGFSQLLSADAAPDKKEKYIANINSCSNQLLTIISDIIDVSKIESHQIEINREEFAIVNALNEVYDDVCIEKKNRNKENVEIKRNFQIEYEHKQMFSDPVRIKQIICNLACNALKFTDQGYVEIGVKKLNKSTVQFYVSDSGIGIEPKYHEAIFNRFHQVDNGDLKKFGGTGLGLSISRSLANLLGGKLYVQSELGKGSTFYFELPVRR